MRKLHKQAEKPTICTDGFRLARVGTKKAIIGWIEIPKYESVDSYVKEYGPAQALAMLERGQAIYEQSLFRPGKPTSPKKAAANNLVAKLVGKNDQQLAVIAKGIGVELADLKILAGM